LLVIDLVVLVAFVALGIAMTRGLRPNWLDHSLDWYGRIFDERARVYAVCTGLLTAAPVVACLTFAVVVLRLVKRGTTTRRLLREPGFVACLAATTGLAASLLLVTPYAWLWDEGGPRSWFWAVLYPQGFAVLGAWGTAWLGGRLRPSSNWVDQLGFVLGAYWVTAVPAAILAGFVLRR
jgi:hypothetical protein